MDFEYNVGIMQSANLFGAWMPMGGQSDIYVARNNLVNEYLKTKHDQLVFIDSDIGFTRDNLMDLISTPYPLVSGIYPDKGEGGDPVLVPLDGGKMKRTDMPAQGCTPVKYVPCGFLKIDRSVLQTMIDKKAVAEYGPEDKPNYQFFNGMVEDRMLLSEDYSFSLLARNLGIVPVVNFKIRLKHDGRPI